MLLVRGMEYFRTKEWLQAARASLTQIDNDRWTQIDELELEETEDW